MGETDLTYVDLFAGAGGLSIGLEIAASNITGDIRDIESEEIVTEAGTESVDLVAGGPPCQGFSEVVSPDGSDERNHLFVNFIDWVRELEPGAALFENVRGMQKTADGKFLDAVKKSFDKLGYEVTHRVVRASDFGVPQHRRR